MKHVIIPSGTRIYMTDKERLTYIKEALESAYKNKDRNTIYLLVQYICTRFHTTIREGLQLVQFSSYRYERSNKFKYDE